ncbi:MAG: YlxR family protein [Solirubrobacteraceae bacterium]
MGRARLAGGDRGGGRGRSQRSRRGAAGITSSRHVPERRCIGCGRRAPKPQLRRLALEGDRVVADPDGTRPGRGAYVCGAECAATALQRRALGRAFRRSVPIPVDLVESVR